MPSVRYRRSARRPRLPPKFASARMLDFIFIAAGTVFFLVTAAYAAGCDRL